MESSISNDEGRTMYVTTDENRFIIIQTYNMGRIINVAVGHVRHGRYSPLSGEDVQKAIRMGFDVRQLESEP